MSLLVNCASCCPWTGLWPSGLEVLQLGSGRIGWSGTRGRGRTRSWRELRLECFSQASPPCPRGPCSTLFWLRRLSPGRPSHSSAISAAQASCSSVPAFTWRRHPAAPTQVLWAEWRIDRETLWNLGPLPNLILREPLIPPSTLRPHFPHS